MRNSLPPLAWLGAAAIAGIALARITEIDFWFFWTAALAGLILAGIFRDGRAGKVFLMAAVFCAGGARLRDAQELPSRHLGRITPAKGVRTFLEGVVDGDPVFRKRTGVFVLRVERVKDGGRWTGVFGRALVRDYEKRPFQYGDRLLLEGTLYRVPGFRISGRVNYRDYLASKGIYSILSVKKGSAVKLIRRKEGNFLKACALEARRRMREVIFAGLSPVSARMVSALILGESEYVEPWLRDALSATGTVHIIAISGLNMGMISFIVLTFLKALRVPGRVRYLSTIAFLIFYSILTGAQVPVVRATIMTSILLAGLVIRREAEAANSMAAAALVILVSKPCQLFEIGFQLSFGSVAALLFLGPAILGIFPEAWRKQKFLRPVFSLLAVSVAAWLGLLPLLVYYFQQLSLVTVLANMFIVPYIGLVVAFAFTFVLAGLVSPLLGMLLSTVSEISLQIFFQTVLLFARIPGGHFQLRLQLPVWAIAGYYCVLIAAGWWLLKYRYRQENTLLR